MTLAATAKAAADTYCASVSPAITDAAAIAKWEGLFSQIATWIAASAIVTVTSVSGVTTGPGVSGPGAGTIT